MGTHIECFIKWDVIYGILRKSCMKLFDKVSRKRRVYLYRTLFPALLAVLLLLVANGNQEDSSKSDAVVDVKGNPVSVLSTEGDEIAGDREKSESAEHTTNIDKQEAASKFDEAAWEKYVLYCKYRDELLEHDERRERIPILGEDGWEYAQNYYREYISCSTFFSREFFTGMLAMEEDAQMRIAVFTGDEMWEYLYYEYDGMTYIRCTTTGSWDDVPECQVCEGPLYYARVSGEDQDSEAEWEEQKERYAEQESRETREYCVVDDHVYEIDREAEQLSDVTGQIEFYMAKWLKFEAQRVACNMKVTQETITTVEEMLPEGFYLSSREPAVAVCDLNKDGAKDYVAAVCYTVFDETRDPATYAELTYEAEAIWLYLSDDAYGEYVRKVLTDGGVYRCTLNFVADGVLMCNDLTGFARYGVSSLETDYFLYDSGEEEFYLDKSFQSKGDIILMEDRDTLGEITMRDYYHGRNSYASEGWGVENYTIPLKNGNSVYVEETAVYRNADKEMERTVNDESFDIVCKVAETVQDAAADEKTVFRMGTCVDYISSRVFSEAVTGKLLCGGRLPVLIDVQSGKYLDITELVSKEEMLQICGEKPKDEDGNELSVEDRERGIRLIEQEYEKADRVGSSGEIILSDEEQCLYFEVTVYGVQVTGEDATGDISFFLDKEYFIDTPLWYYMEPDFP